VNITLKACYGGSERETCYTLFKRGGIMECKFCKEFKKKYPPIDGADNTTIHQISEHTTMSEVNCYFDDSKPKNWNCQILNKFRDIFDWWMGDVPPKGILYFHREDQNTLFIDISQIFPCEDDIYLNWLYLTWYKRRGAVDNVQILFEYEPARDPTEEELIKILKAYNGT